MKQTSNLVLLLSWLEMTVQARVNGLYCAGYSLPDPQGFDKSSTRTFNGRSVCIWPGIEDKAPRTDCSPWKGDVNRVHRLAQWYLHSLGLTVVLVGDSQRIGGSCPWPHFAPPSSQPNQARLGSCSASSLHLMESLGRRLAMRGTIRVLSVLRIYWLQVMASSSAFRPSQIKFVRIQLTVCCVRSNLHQSMEFHTTLTSASDIMTN